MVGVASPRLWVVLTDLLTLKNPEATPGHYGRDGHIGLGVRLGVTM